MANHDGWSGQVLWVDLDKGSINAVPVTGWLPDFVGGVGLAAALAWAHLRPGMNAFDPGNPLMIMTGPLTGTLASGAGRVEVCGIAPQQRPSVFSRSGMGGHWGAELKFAGWDGVVVTGVSQTPVYLWINNQDVELGDATDLWGAGTLATTRRLMGRHGKGTRVVTIGPAGENRSRIASLHTETGNAAGQGGYGGLMGAKQLKAIAVRGTGGVRLANPDAFLRLCLGASREGFTPSRSRPSGQSVPGFRQRKCGFCMTPCTHPLAMGQSLRPGETLSGVALQCYGFMTPERRDPVPRMLASDLGINGWEVSYGIIPWLQMCKQHGLIDAIDGFPIPIPDEPIHYLHQSAPVSAEFVRMLLLKIAHREGPLGDALAEGACRAADMLFGGRGADLLDPIYPRRAGQTSHWAGHWGPGGQVVFPHWLIPVLQWCVDTRDPASDSTHAWTVHSVHYLNEDGPLPRDKVLSVAEKVYGRCDVADAGLSYQSPGAKAAPAVWHHLRGMLIDSLILCDYEHARVFSMLSDDGQADTALMAKLFSAATGFDTSESQLDQSARRIWTLLRAIDAHYFGRTRAVDETSLKAYLLPGKDDGVALDVAAFMPLLSAYYALMGWDKTTGLPTRDTLDSLGLGEASRALHGDMTAS